MTPARSAKRLLSCDGNQVLSIPTLTGYQYQACPGCAACRRPALTDPTPASIAASWARLPGTYDEGEPF